MLTAAIITLALVLVANVLAAREIRHLRRLLRLQQLLMAPRWVNGSKR